MNEEWYIEDFDVEKRFDIFGRYRGLISGKHGTAVVLHDFRFDSLETSRTY